MLNPCVHQAAGLQELALQTVPRLVAVTSHGPRQDELQLLWGLCSAWADSGFAVVVLDGHAQESRENPGLLQLLDNRLEPLDHEECQAEWTVLPSAFGFDRLTHHGTVSDVLGELFQNYGVVLIYSDSSVMTQLLKGTDLMPLLVLSPVKTSTLTAYQALKRLLLDAQLRPTIANIAQTPTIQRSASSQSPLTHLQNCAMTFLGYDLKPLTVTAALDADGSMSDDVNGLALRMLENAIFLDRHLTERFH